MSTTTADPLAIEYQSSFPTNHSDSGDSLARPTVLLFGWFGCRDQYLAKYSELYNKQG